MLGWVVTQVSVTLAFIISALILYGLYGLDASLKHRRRGRPDGIVEVPGSPPDPNIVAVHGLGANPDLTWTSKLSKRDLENLLASTNLPARIKEGLAKVANEIGVNETRRISLLDHVLRPEFPEARILKFCYNSDWFINAPVVTPEEIASRLLDELKRVRSNSLSTPIIFIGHSFGGIAFLGAPNDIKGSSCGIVFLGTPHNGSRLSRPAAVLALVSGVLGSDTTLLFALKRSSMDLFDLETKFRDAVHNQGGRREELKIVSFYENLPTRAFGLLSIGLVSTDALYLNTSIRLTLSHTVDAPSAFGAAPNAIGIDVDHVDLNKSPKIYAKLTHALHGLKSQSEPSLNENQLCAVERLDPLAGAAFNPELEQLEGHETVCYPNTRVDLLERIQQWVRDTEGKCIFWLQGMAGTGKSTVSRTITWDLIQQDYFVASFFFRRNAEEPDRVNPARLFPTIASQLVRCLPSMAGHVRNAIEDAKASPHVARWTRKQQFDKLILGPLKKIDKDPKTPKTIIIVLDALDECDQDKSIDQILDVLPDVMRLPSVKIKFIVTSRPESYICDVMDQSRVAAAREKVILHEEPMTRHDISVFVKFRMEAFRDDRNQKTTSGKSQRLPANWPGENNIVKIVELAVPLFIFASTACRFIEDRRHEGTPNEKLERILKQKTRSPSSQLTKTYLPTLEQMVYELDGDGKGDSIRDFKEIVGPIVLLARPLSTKSLAALLGIKVENVDSRLDWLHSVLNVPSDPETPITLFHQSFRDFLINPKLTNEFSVNEIGVHEQLCRRCLKAMEDLREDICCQKKPGTLQQNVDKREIDRCLKPELQYACLYWVEHLQKSGYEPKDGDQVHKFLQCRFLHWLEALAWIGKVLDGIDAIIALESISDAPKSPELSKYVYDMKRFIQEYQACIKRTPLQVYCSALIFAPASSLVKKQFEKCVPLWIRQLPAVENDWNSVQTLEGHLDGVTELVFSPDGKLLASGSEDGVIGLWHLEMGTLIRTLEHHENLVSDRKDLRLITALAFSQSSKQLASMSLDGVVRLWNPKTGMLTETLHQIKIHDNAQGDRYPDRVVLGFGKDNKLLAALYKTVGPPKLWSLTSATSTCVKLEFSHKFGKGFVKCLTITQDGQVEAVTGTLPSTTYFAVHYWHPDCFSKAVAFSQYIEVDHIREYRPIAAALSHNGKRLAVASNQELTLLDRDSEVITEARKFTHEQDGIRLLEFSQDGERLAAVSDNTIKLWDATTDRFTRIKHFTDQIFIFIVALSPTGKQLAWPSEHGTIRLWQVARQDCRVVQHDRVRGEYEALTFLDDGKQLAWVSSDGAVTLQNLNTGAEKTLPSLTSDVSLAWFSPDCKHLTLTSRKDFLVRLWDFTSGRHEPEMLDGHVQTVRAIVFSPDGTHLASASFHLVILWDISSYPVTKKSQYPIEYCRNITFSDDGKWLTVSGSRDVRLLDLTADPLAKPRKLYSSKDTTRYAAISRKQKLAVVEDFGELVQLYDLTKRAEPKTLRRNMGDILAIAFSPNSDQLALASRDGKVGLWNLTSDLDETGPRECLEVGTVVRSLSFPSTGSYIQTERGRLQFEASSLSLSTSFFLKQDWLSVDGENVLWIPPEHRSGDVAVYEDMIGYFDRFGQAQVIKFDLDILRQVLS
ncbi:MAG: hypothetical protein M1820_007999 [Bogoriella megaspora]|nr:MAG: hypothetical protein M1820_007999 [Bogoriella megaspora]